LRFLDASSAFSTAPSDWICLIFFSSSKPATISAAMMRGCLAGSASGAGLADFGDAGTFARTVALGIVETAQCRMARAALKLGVRDLAEMAKVSPATIVRFEASDAGVLERTIDAIQRALEAAGVEFTNGEQPGVRMRKSTNSI
jgi:hypothetical protein